MEPKRLYIDGEWIETGRTFTVVNPGTGAPVAEGASAGRDETRRAVESAAAAFPAWRRLTGMQRGDYLLAIADALRRRHEEVARTVTEENGKPVAQSRGEVNVAIDHLRWFAEEARRGYGRVVPHQVDGKRHVVFKQPVGVVGLIAPWNFPLVLAVRKLAPALAAGCTAILRPARQTPLCAVALAECVEEAALPRGVFHMLTGPGEPIVAEFMENPTVRKISFTGSTEVGKSLIEQSAETVTDLSLELGGHAPLLIFADADLELAVEGALITKFRNTGQSCIASNRIYVERSIYAEFLERFVERARRLKVGYGLEEGVDIGPVINREGLETALAHVENAVAAGARVLCGGRAAEETRGFYLEPTVIADVPDDALCMSEETFAPVAPVAAFDSEEEAIERANASRYGLAAYAYTSDLNRSWRLAEGLEAGTVAVNDAVPSTSNAPFGGIKESGLGRELGPEGMDAFMETKHISYGAIS
ncbi:MAG: NAD-dependent succinate-semialdehyde dehydrogenase [Spirochaetales bacterium]|nr:NAD-dependent succinate-semialdehyde dehydrogenase [Spirochaetales bacterium]